jgi:S1-C subfamily serine protease
MKRLGVFLAVICLLSPAAMSFAQQETEGAKMLRRVKPAVVFIQSTISAKAEITTAQGPKSVEVPLPSIRGSGFIINPNGYVVTNGHVIEQYHQSDVDEIKKKAFERLV